MTEVSEAQKNYENLFKLMIKKFDLFKKQSTTDSLIKKGEINAINKMTNIIETQIKALYLAKEEKKKSFKDSETSLKKFNINEFGPKYAKELYSALSFSKSTLTKNKAELNHFMAVEKLFELLDNNLESSLSDLDLLSAMEKSREKPSKDIEVRMETGKCALKRPGRIKFPCEKDLVPGEKYCKEHLKQFHPDRYFDIFENLEDKE